MFGIAIDCLSLYTEYDKQHSERIVSGRSITWKFEDDAEMRAAIIP